MITGTDAFVIAAGAGVGLADAANKRAAQAAWDSRINAFLAQGMTYDQARACAADTYRQEAARLGPRGASGWTAVGLVLGLLFCAVVSVPVINGLSYVFMALAGCCVLGLLRQRRLFVARAAWKRGCHQQDPHPIRVWVSVRRKAIGSA